MSTSGETKVAMQRLRDMIEKLSGVDPIETNHSPAGTEADRRYVWQNPQLRMVGYSRTFPDSTPTHTRGPEQTLTALSVLLCEVLTKRRRPEVQDSYIRGQLDRLTTPDHHYAIQVRSDRPTTGLGDPGSRATFGQTRWMNLTPEQFAVVRSVFA